LLKPSISVIASPQRKENVIFTKITSANSLGVSLHHKIYFMLKLLRGKEENVFFFVDLLFFGSVDSTFDKW
jgi:hypothetical protein